MAALTKTAHRALRENCASSRGVGPTMDPDIRSGGPAPGCMIYSYTKKSFGADGGVLNKLRVAGSSNSTAQCWTGLSIQSRSSRTVSSASCKGPYPVDPASFFLQYYSSRSLSHNPALSYYLNISTPFIFNTQAVCLAVSECLSLGQWRLSTVLMSGRSSKD